MLNVLLIDDELKSIKSLKWELESFCSNVKIDAFFTDPEEALLYLKNHDIDCVFLDIEMPNMDGFQFLQNFEDRSFEVVFVTAYDQYAVKAIKESALDYLLKPIDSDDLINTIEKIKTRRAPKVKDLLEESLLDLSNSNKRIAIPVDGKLVFLHPEEVLYCESDGNYCKIFLENEKSLFVSKKLKEIQAILPEDKFYRVHNSYVVNMKRIREYLKQEGYVMLDNGKKIPVSRNKKSSFLEKM